MADKKVALEVEITAKGGVNEVDKSVKSIKTELREAKEEAIQMSRKFGELSPEATNAAKKFATLKDEMGDLADKVNGLNPDKFSRMSTLTNGMVRGFQAAQGAAVMFGGTSVDIEKTIAKLQATMAMADGIQGVLDARKSFISFGQDVVASARKMALAVQGFSNASKIALAATGIGLIVIALGAIITYWDDIKIAMQGANSEQAKSQAKYEATKKELNNQLQTHKDTHAQQLLSGKTERQILETEIKITEQLLAQEELKLSIQEKELNRAVAEREKLGAKTGGLIYMWGMWKTPEEIKAAGEIGFTEQRKSIETAKENLAKSKIEIAAIDKIASDKAIAKGIKNKQTEKEKEQAKYDEYKRIHEVAIAQEIQEEKDRDARIKYREDGQAKFNQEKEDERLDGIKKAEKDAADKKTAQEKELADLKAVEQAKLEVRMAALDNLASIGQSIVSLAGKNKALAKAGLAIEEAVGIAKIVINTQVAAAKANATYPPPFGQIAAGIAIASGALSIAASVKATQKAMQQLGGGDSTNDTTMNQPTGGGFTAATTGFTQIRTPQLGTGTPTGEKIPPQKVIIVQKDITDAAKVAVQIESKAIVK